MNWLDKKMEQYGILAPFSLLFMSGCYYKQRDVLQFNSDSNGDEELIILKESPEHHYKVMLLSHFNHTEFLIKYNKFLHI